MFKSVDSALYGLFDIASLHPQSVKSIFFSDGARVDANSIQGTVDYNNSRIPAEKITLARGILSKCYDSIDNQLSALFFLYNYGFLDDYSAPLIGGIVILTNENAELVSLVLKGYRNKKATPLSDIAAQHALDYYRADNICRKIRKQITKFHHDIWESTEDILINSEFLVY